MKNRIIPWATMYSHIPQETIVQGVSRLHLSAFAPDYFKTVWLDNKRSIQNMYKDEKYLSSLKLPACIISYEVDDDPKNTMDAGDFPYNYASHFVAGNLSTYYWRVYHNPENHIQIYSAFIRKKVTFTFRYVFPDVHTRDDVYDWMTNTFRYGGPPINFGNKMSICAALPTTMVEYLAMTQQYALTDPAVEKAFNGEFSQYSSGILRLNKVTMQDASKMWFMVYRLPKMKLLQPNRPEKGDGETQGQTKVNFEITETLECEPYFPQMFITKVPEIVHNVTTPAKYKASTFAIAKGGDKRVFNTMNVDIDPTIIDLDLGVHQVLSNIEFGIDHDGEETLPIDVEVFATKHQKVISLLKRANENVSDYYSFGVYRFNQKLREGTDYTIDWDSMEVKFLTLKASSVYRIVGACYSKAVDPYLKGIEVHDHTTI